MKTFKNIFDFQKEFSSEEKCREYLEQQRWNGTPACPFCGSVNVHRFPNGKIFKCREKGCRNKFSVTVGTIYENTKISLTKWFLATYILSVHSKGISSLQLAGWLGVTQKTAWHLNHRIREMLTDKAPELLEGIVEVDETYVGGSLANIHKSKKEKLKGLDNKTMVFGAVERGGKVRVKVIPQTNIENVTEAIEGFVASDSTMVTDEHHAYNKVGQKYNHRKVNHRNTVGYLKQKSLINMPCDTVRHLGGRVMANVNNKQLIFNCYSLQDIEVIQQDVRQRDNHNLKSKITLEGKAFLYNEQMQDLLKEVNEAQIKVNNSTVTLNEKTGTFYTKQTSFNRWQKWLTFAIASFTLVQIIVSVKDSLKPAEKMETIILPSTKEIEQDLRSLKQQMQSQEYRDSLFRQMVKDSLRIH